MRKWEVQIMFLTLKTKTKKFHVHELTYLNTQTFLDTLNIQSKLNPHIHIIFLFKEGSIQTGKTLHLLNPFRILNGP